MKWLTDIIEIKLNRWHMRVHSNFDFMKLIEANKRIDDLVKERDKFGEENKKLKLQLDIKQMNDFLEGR
jgi:hypothetical protein